MSASFFGILKTHNHTSQVGDGGMLTSLSVGSGLTVTSGALGVSAGNVNVTGSVNETVGAAAGVDVPQYQQAAALAMLLRR